jgi:DNA-binding response OmpR family regulator
MNATHLNVPCALLLDSDPAALRAALDARGFDVLTAADGAGGLELLLESLMGLDVLLVDADLPGRNAEGFLALVRDAGNESELGIVVVADALTAERRRALLAGGADAVVDRRHGPAVVAEAAAAAASLSLQRRRPCSAWGDGSPLEVVLDAVRALASPVELRAAFGA